MKLPHTEVKFYPEVKSQTGLSSLRVSCKLVLKDEQQFQKTKSEEMVARSVDKNNSGFVSIKFNLILLRISTLIINWLN